MQNFYQPKILKHVNLKMAMRFLKKFDVKKK